MGYYLSGSVRTVDEVSDGPQRTTDGPQMDHIWGFCGGLEDYQKIAHKFNSSEFYFLLTFEVHTVGFRTNLGFLSFH